MSPQAKEYKMNATEWMAIAIDVSIMYGLFIGVLVLGNKIYNALAIIF
jgi:tetrahydromethanopterin S-methyltransferase subunit G